MPNAGMLTCRHKWTSLHEFLKLHSVAVQAREAAQEAVRRSQENLDAARAKAAEAAGATKSQAQQAAERAVQEAEEAAAYAREKVFHT